MQEAPCNFERPSCAEGHDCFSALSNSLRKSGGRLTTERSRLVHMCCDMEDHWTPEALADSLADRGVPIALTTVYRNIPLMVCVGIIRRTDHLRPRAGAETYEHIWGREHHDHLVCSRCGLRVEFTYPAIEVLQEAVAREHGFSLERHYLELGGVCAKCRKKDET